MGKYIMALDAGTTSNRCILFNEKGERLSVAQREFTQYFPKPGWVEHDADEIWASMLGVAVEAMTKIGADASKIAAIVELIKVAILLPLKNSPVKRATGRENGMQNINARKEVNNVPTINESAPYVSLSGWGSHSVEPMNWKNPY